MTYRNNNTLEPNYGEIEIKSSIFATINKNKHTQREGKKTEETVNYYDHYF